MSVGTVFYLQTFLTKISIPMATTRTQAIEMSAITTADKDAGSEFMAGTHFSLLLQTAPVPQHS